MTVIGGRYRLDERVGRGGAGEVWLADDLRLERPVAVKLLHPWVADDEAARRRFEREAAVLTRLRHPHIVTLLDVDVDADRPYLVQDYCAGGTLAALVASAPHPWPAVRAIALPIAEALAHAHAQGVVHRDLKPSNVLFARDGHLLVADFGLARLTASEEGTITDAGTRMGSPEYWSPEQASGQTVSERSDLYSLGVMLYELLTGREPFPGEDRWAAGYRRVHEDPPSPATLVRGLPPAVDDLVRRLMARDPARRPRAADVAAALRRTTPPGGRSAARAPAPPPEGATAVLGEDRTRVLPRDVTAHTAVAPPGAMPQPTTAPRRPVPEPERPGLRSTAATAAVLLGVVGAALVVGALVGGGAVELARDGVRTAASPSRGDATAALAALVGAALITAALAVLAIWSTRGSDRARGATARVALSGLALVTAATASAAFVWTVHAATTGDVAELWRVATAG